MLGEGFYVGPYGDTIDKDPQSVLTYGVALAQWLEPGDTLASVTFTAPTGLLVVAQSINSAVMTLNGATQAVGTVALVKLRDGILGVVYPVRLHVITTAGDEEDFTLHFNLVAG